LRDGFGLSPGDRLAIVMRNRPDYLETLFAIWHAGLVAVPVNARLYRDEIASILDHSGSVVVVTDDEHAADIKSLIGAVASLQAAVKRILAFSAPPTPSGSGSSRRYFPVNNPPPMD
jgi:acyl-CoA synthetase (AMP-forming)/AMP-acid ligase II